MTAIQTGEVIEQNITPAVGNIQVPGNKHFKHEHLHLSLGPQWHYRQHQRPGLHHVNCL